MSKSTTGQSLSFSMKFINDHLDLNAGVKASQTISWSTNGRVNSSISYTINTAAVPYHIELSYCRGETNFKYNIELTTSTPHYGGKRWWFICPITKERCGVLYLPPHSTYFASRKGHNIAYTSQNESWIDRFTRRRAKYYDKHNIDYTMAYFPRPKGMHHRTYNRCMEKADNYEQQLYSILAKL